MRNFKFGTLVLGILLIAVGVIYAGNVLNIWDIAFFFRGWWTLFIIVPCVVSMFNNGVSTGNLIGTAVGVLLLLNAQRIVPMDIIFKLLVPAILVAIGIKLLFGNNYTRRFKSINSGSSSYGAYFGEQRLNYNGLVFNGVDVSSIFGSVTIDLRGAIIQNEAAINVTCIFGGVDILCSENQPIKSGCLSIFGGVSNKNSNVVNDQIPTVYLGGSCIFGGVSIKN